MANPPDIELYFDFVSPYAYLAWHLVRPVAARHGRRIEPVPILFAGVLNALGTKGPAEIPAKRRYLIRDVARKAADAGVAFELPPAHPFNSLLALRLSSLPLPSAQRLALIDGLWGATWGGGPGVADEAAVRPLLDRLGLPRQLVGEAQGPESKARLRAQTDRALALGIFGVPSMLVGDELFFGTDSVPHLDRFLAGGSLVSPELVARWERLPAAAQRTTRSAS